MSLDLRLGDCLDVMGEIPEGSINLVLCDLPYGTTACKWDTVIPFAPLWEHYRRLLKPRGAVVLMASQPFASALVMSNPKWFRHEWVWNKRFAANFALARKAPLKIHENVLVFSPSSVPYVPQMRSRESPIKLGANRCRSESSKIAKPRPEYEGKVYSEKYPESILFYSGRDEIRRFHPTQKPVALMEYLIKTYSNDGDTVLDNCFGSCTTGVACINTGRNFIGIEQDPGYFAIAERRIAVELAKTALLTA